MGGDHSVKRSPPPNGVPRSCLHSGGSQFPPSSWALRVRGLSPSGPSGCPSFTVPRTLSPCPSPESPLLVCFTAQTGTFRRGSKGYSRGPQGLLGGRGSPWVQAALPSRGVPAALCLPVYRSVEGEGQAPEKGCFPQSMNRGPCPPGPALSLGGAWGQPLGPLSQIP